MAKRPKFNPLATKGKGAYDNEGAKKTGIKVIHDVEVDEKKLVICKSCHAAVKHGKMKEAIAAL